jgi:hypothetical protein
MALTCYNKEIRKAKWSSWRNYCWGNEDVPDRARLMRIMASQSANLNRNQLRIMTGLLLKGHLFKLGLVKSPECNRCKQASETASHILFDCDALVTLRFRHLGHHFTKPGYFEDISVSKILHFVQGEGLLNE